MITENVLDILKNAILMEKKGKAFFESVAKQTQNESVREIFESMAEEELGHIKYLSEHFKNVRDNGKFMPVEKPEDEDEFSHEIITKKIREEVEAASYEASAINAAMLFEKQAVDFYTSQAEQVKSEEAREVLQWLASWEKTHLKLMEDLDRELREKVWNDNNFWPF
ncbi:MAG: hypothetical protein Kow00108_10140 [Calditrichia bacterium]